MATPPTALPTGELDPDELIDRTLRGDEGAWGALVELVHPRVVRLCLRRAGASYRSEDAAHDVAARVVERLEHDDYAALRHYVRAREKYPESSFGRWLSTVVGNTYVDWVRRLPEASRVRVPGGRAIHMADVVSMGDAIDPASPRAGVDRVVEVRRILARIASAGFPPEQRRALVIWLRGGSATDVADELGLAGPADGKRLLHAARARLRRMFHEASN
jgi:DNA-directed RNA polymerase specialized sigma24 family protein